MTERLMSQNSKEFNLHDCRAASAEIDGSTLIFFFPDGIQRNDGKGEWTKTGNARVELELNPNYGGMIQVIEEKDNRLILEEHSLEYMIDKINSVEWEVEFLYEFHGYKEVLYTCEIHLANAPYFIRGQIFINISKDITYRWNQ